MTAIERDWRYRGMTVMAKMTGWYDADRHRSDGGTKATLSVAVSAYR